MLNNVSTTFLEFAWNSLTDQQQFRINVKYELVQKLKNKEPGKSKRSMYRAIAEKYGYTMRRIERIANEDLR